MPPARPPIGKRMPPPVPVEKPPSPRRSSMFSLCRPPRHNIAHSPARRRRVPYADANDNGTTLGGLPGADIKRMFHFTRLRARDPRLAAERRELGVVPVLAT